MNGTDALSTGAVGSFNPGPSWQIKGTGDFNGDGKSDILWQDSDGTTAIWLMNGTNVVIHRRGRLVNPGPSWQIEGTGDFNGDGKSDILWQNSDGTPAIWLMNGTNALSIGAVGPFNPGPSWHVEGTGDFNGDGKSDILWQARRHARGLADGRHSTSSPQAQPARSIREVTGTSSFKTRQLAVSSPTAMRNLS